MLSLLLSARTVFALTRVGNFDFPFDLARLCQRLFFFLIFLFLRILVFSHIRHSFPAFILGIVQVIYTRNWQV